MSKTIDQPKHKRLGKTPLRYSHMTVHDKVDSWNWNMNIFEIYDELNDYPPDDQKNLLRYAYEYFGKDNMINELHSHLIGVGVEDDA